jgi:hypothetical protein
LLTPEILTPEFAGLERHVDEHQPEKPQTEQLAIDHRPGRRAGLTLRTQGMCGIAVMAKESVPGRTKTRLVPPLTYDDAARLNTAFLQDAADNMLLAANYAGIRGYAACAPRGADAFFREILPSAIGLIDAQYPNFGDCLFHTITHILAGGHQSAVVLNADSPNLPTALLIEAAEVLARPGERAVLGPSDDGGYYLLGLKTPRRRLFEDIAWSTDQVAAQTMERVREIGLDIHLLPTWYDVDDIDDLRRLHRETDQGAAANGSLVPHYPVATARLMRGMWPHGEFGRRRTVIRAAAARM